MSTSSITLTPTTVPALGTSTTERANRTTVVDMVSHLRDYLGTNVNQEAHRAIIRSIQAGLRELVNARTWSYLYQRHRIATNEPYDTGTIQYQVSAGTYPRQVTLTSGTWPSWANLGTLAIGTVTYEIVRRISDSIVQMDSVVNSAADIASGTSYTLYSDTYVLPEDFVASDRAYAEISWGGMEFVHPHLWLQVTRYYRSSSDTPRYYTFTGDPRAAGRMCMRLFPYPDSARTIDLVYHRRPRKITLEKYNTGTVTADASGGSTTTITGSGTAWTSSMVGSVIRLSSDALNLPTDLAGSNPYAVERTIKVVSSATSLTVDEAIDTSYTGVKYEISDPIDIEDGAMLEAYFRCCEKHLATVRKHSAVGDATALYRDALIRAMEADSRSFAGRVAGPGGVYRQRFADMPRGDDVS